MQYVLTLLLVCWAIVVAYFDIRYRRIPNVLSLGAWVAALLILLTQGHSLTGASLASTGGAAAFALLVTLPGYLTHRLGAGDVKYLTAIGLLTSLPLTSVCFVIGALGGGVLAATWLLAPRILEWMPAMPDGQMTRRLSAWATMPMSDRKMPYGAFLSAGLVAALWFAQRP